MDRDLQPLPYLANCLAYGIKGWTLAGNFDFCYLEVVVVVVFLKKKNVFGIVAELCEDVPVSLQLSTRHICFGFCFGVGLCS